MSKRAIRKHRHRSDAEPRETFKEAVARGQRERVEAGRKAGYRGDALADFARTNAARQQLEH